MVVLDQFSTAGLAPAARLSYWNDLVLSAVGPIEIEAERSRPFDAALTRLRAGSLEIVSPRSSPAIVRNRRGVSDPGILNLSVQHLGRATSVTGGESTMLESGDFVLYDPTQSLESRFSEPIQQIVLRLPYEDVVRRLPAVRSVVGRRMRGDCGAGRLLSSFIRTSWEELSGGQKNEWGDSLCELIWPLLALAYRVEHYSHREQSLRERRRARMLAFIDAHLREPALGAGEIAAALGVSTRYVQLLFVGMQTTPSAFILDRRLEVAAQELARRGSGARITDVALDLGFNHLSTFCRSFRRKYHVAPRDYRGGHRPPDTQ